MSRDSTYQDEICEFCKNKLFTFLLPYKVGEKKFCCRECGDDYLKQKRSLRVSKWGVYDKDYLLAVFFEENMAKDYEKYLNRKMQTCRFESFKIAE